MTTNYEILRQRFEDQKRQKEPIHCLYHVTSKEKRNQIIEDGLLKRNSTANPSFVPLASNLTVQGVWFCATLFREALPTQSPYGDSRIKVPCEMILKSIKEPRLFLEAIYYFRGGASKNQYVRLVLLDVTKHQEALQFCRQHCIPLDVADNPFLQLDLVQNVYHCIKNTAGSGANLPDVWLEILVVGDVKLIYFDKVEDTGLNWNAPNQGLSPSVTKVDPATEAISAMSVK